MVGILSASSDTNVDYVIAWLQEYEYEYVRINADEVLDPGFYFDIIHDKLIINNEEVPVSNINVLWYRKFGGFSKTRYFKTVKDDIKHSDLQQLSSEYNSILVGIISLFKGKKWITSPWLAHLNKIDILRLAKNYGITVPQSWILSDKNNIPNISVITKSVFEPHFIEVEAGFYSMFTKVFEDSKDIPEQFFPSLLQERIIKDYEIRSFYFFGKFYSMAIFSQSNAESKEDFRKYDFTKPNKRIPYKLPVDLEKKLDKMLKSLALNCCSIDIIKSVNGEYIFLEINPTGEFGMTGMPCNYNLYQIIAEKLIELDHE